MAEPLAPAQFTRRDAGRIAVAAIAGALIAGGVTFAFDAPIREAIQSFKIHRDLKRELEMLQQFGGTASMVIVGAVIGLVQPWRFRRMLDWLLAAGIGWVVFGAMKITTGRLRPRVPHEGSSWIGPTGSFHVGEVGEGVKLPSVTVDAFHPYQFWRTGVYESLSMPSTHTTHAAIAAAFLVGLYPRLRWLVVPWIIVVGFGRVHFGSHWPSDVVVGGILGWGLGAIVCRSSAGVRLVDWVWKTIVDRNATPALPKLEEAEWTHPR